MNKINHRLSLLLVVALLVICIKFNFFDQFLSAPPVCSPNAEFCLVLLPR